MDQIREKYRGGNIPPAMIGSFEWAVKERVFRGSLESYVDLQYCAYQAMCVRYLVEPISFDKWLSTYGSRRADV